MTRAERRSLREWERMRATLQRIYTQQNQQRTNNPRRTDDQAIPAIP